MFFPPKLGSYEIFLGVAFKTLRSEDRMNTWKPYGCAMDQDAVTDIRGFRQCVVADGKIKKEDRKHKTEILKDLLRKQQVRGR